MLEFKSNEGRALSWAVKLSIDGERPKTYEVDVDSVPI
jgi:hypothetical protein